MLCIILKVVSHSVKLSCKLSKAAVVSYLIQIIRVFSVGCKFTAKGIGLTERRRLRHWCSYVVHSF